MNVCIKLIFLIQQSKNITLKSTLTTEYAFADINMVDTVIRNLINNAIKFTPEGGQVTLSAKTNSTHVEVQITDTGVGIDPKRLDGLFRMSEHSTTNGTDGETGTGLGLLLCQEFVERNGGRISVTSSLGGGSTFSFTLPLSAPDL